MTRDGKRGLSWTADSPHALVGGRSRRSGQHPRLYPTRQRLTLPDRAGVNTGRFGSAPPSSGWSPCPCWVFWCFCSSCSSRFPLHCVPPRVSRGRYLAILLSLAAALTSPRSPRSRGQPAWPWIALAFASNVIAEGIYGFLVVVCHQNQPFPSAADAFYLVFYRHRAAAPAHRGRGERRLLVGELLRYGRACGPTRRWSGGPPHAAIKGERRSRRVPRVRCPVSGPGIPWLQPGREVNP